MRWNEEQFDEDYEQQELYNNALTMVRIIEENMSLKRENKKLRKELEERNGYIDKQYKNTIQQTGNILSLLIDKAEQDRIK